MNGKFIRQDALENKSLNRSIYSLFILVNDLIEENVVSVRWEHVPSRRMPVLWFNFLSGGEDSVLSRVPVFNGNQACPVWGVPF